MTANPAPMTLRLLTPGGVLGEAGCDSVRLILRDGVGGTCGGSVGIQRDHIPAVMVLGRGAIRASLGGKTVFLAYAEDGFASVKDNVITVITDSAAIRDDL